jgi:hypothetical protein
VVTVVEALILSTVHPWRFVLLGTRLAVAGVLLAPPMWRKLR